MSPRTHREHPRARAARRGAGALVVLLIVLVWASGGAARSGNAGRVPAVPANLKVVSASLSTIGLKWKASRARVGSSRYRIYVNRGLDSVRGSTHYLANHLRCGTSYTFSVVAFDSARKRSKPASVVASTSPCPSATPSLSPASPSGGDTASDAGAPSASGPSRASRADTSPPDLPGGLMLTQATESSLSVSWAASSDDTGVSAYEVYLDGVLAGTASTTSFTFTGLACGSTYALSVDALDAAGNRSGATSISGSTPGCPDASAPTAPMFLLVSGASATTLTVTWLASVDDVGVTGYDVALDGSKVATVAGPLLSYTFAGLQCGTGYTLAVTASDAAGNVSPASTTTASTSACPAAPPVSLTFVSPTATTLTGRVVWEMSPSAPVGRIDFSIDGGSPGWTESVAPFMYNGDPNGRLDTTALANGSHTLTATAYSAAGTKVASASNTVTIANASSPGAPTTTTTATSPPPDTTPASAPTPAQGPSGAPSCAVTIGPASSLAATIAATSSGGTVCLGSGGYGDLALTGVAKAADVTVQPAAGADVTIGTLVIQRSSHIRFTGTGGSMKLGGLDLDPTEADSSWSHDLTFDHVTWTAPATVRTHATGQAIVFDSDVFDNIQAGLYEGRITVRGYDNTAPVGVTISHSHFGGGCSDGVQVIGNANGVQIGPGNEFTGIQQLGCDPVHADPIQLYGAVGTFVTGNWFHDNGDGTGGLDSFAGDSPATVTDNVFVCTCVYPWSVAAWGARGWVIQHNTIVGGAARFQVTDSGTVPSGNVVRDNVWAGGGGISADTDGYGTNDHNLNSGRSGTGNLTGTPVFAGGGNPSTYAGYALASGSPGKGAASDGGDMGIRANG